MKELLSIFCLSFVFSISGAFAAGPVNTKCPIKGKAVDAKSKTAGVEVQFCCGKCKAKFDGDVLNGLKKFAATEDGKCPISGKSVKGSKKSTPQVGVCCGGCKKKVEAEPKKHLAKVK